jgi:hypothetical protein
VKSTSSPPAEETLPPLRTRRAWWRRIPPGWFLLPILLLAFGFRYMRIDYGLPYVYPWDEPEIINPAINVLRYGDYRPTRFAYGPMNGYLHAGWGALTFVRGVEKGKFPDDIYALTSNRDTAWYWAITSDYFLRQARVFSVLLGLVTVIFVYAAGVHLGGLVVGLWAASVMALSRTSIIQSSTVTADSTAMTTTAMVLWASCHMLTHRPRWSYWTAGILSGLTLGLKYTSFPVVLFPIIAHVLSCRRERCSILDGRIVSCLSACMVTLCLALFPVFLQPTRFLHDLATEALYYGPSGRSALLDYVKGSLRGFLVTMDAADSERLFMVSGVFLVCVLIIGLFTLARRNVHILLFLLLPALLNIHFVGEHASHFFGRNLLLSMEPFSIIGGFGLLWLSERAHGVGGERTSADLRPWLVPALFIICFSPLVLWAARTGIKTYTYVEPRRELSEKMRAMLPKDTRIIAASETRWYMNRDELRHFRMTENPILRMMMDPPPTTVAEYLILPTHVRFFQPTPQKEEFGKIINDWLAKTKPVDGYQFGSSPIYFGKPSNDPQVRLVKNTPELWQERLITTNKVYGTQYTATTRNPEARMSDEGTAVRPGVVLTAMVRIPDPVTQVTVQARGTSPFRQPITPELQIEIVPGATPNGKAVATAQIALNRSQAGLLEYSRPINVKPGDYFVRLRATDPEDYRVEIGLLTFQ